MTIDIDHRVTVLSLGGALNVFSGPNLNAALARLYGRRRDPRRDTALIDLAEITPIRSVKRSPIRSKSP